MTISSYFGGLFARPSLIFHQNPSDMKYKVLLPILLMLSALASAQSNHLVVFSEEGYPFYLVVNGVAYNTNPETSVRATGVQGQTVKLKFIFADQALGEVNKTAQLPSIGREYTYKVKRSASGDWLLKLENSVVAPDLAPPAVVQTTVVQPAATVNTATSTGTYYSASSTGTSSSFATNAGGGVSVNVSGVGINPNPLGLPTVHDVSVGIATYDAVQTHHQPVSNHYVMPGYNGPIGCPWPMDNGQFASARQTVAANTWDETRLTVSKQIISANCLTCAQVRELMMVMGWEESKLDLAKFAYGYTYDLGNYYLLNSAFEWESSVTDLNNFINRR
jgi:hypothetical protein